MLIISESYYKINNNEPKTNFWGTSILLKDLTEAVKLL